LVDACPVVRLLISPPTPTPGRLDGRESRLIWTTSGLVARKSANIKPSVALPPIEAGAPASAAEWPVGRCVPGGAAFDRRYAAVPSNFDAKADGRGAARRCCVGRGSEKEESDAWMRLRARSERDGTRLIGGDMIQSGAKIRS